MQEGVHHFIHAVIERGGEQHVLGVGRNLLKQSLDRWQEAHIGHFVGLIDDHDFDAVRNIPRRRNVHKNSCSREGE